MVSPVSLRVTPVPHTGTAGLLTGYTMGPHTVTLRSHTIAPSPRTGSRPVGALWAEEGPGRAEPS